MYPSQQQKNIKREKRKKKNYKNELYYIFLSGQKSQLPYK